MKIKIKDKERYFDGYLHQNLKTCVGLLPKDWDMVFVVDGLEGTGKSVMAQQMAAFADPDLTIDRITFTPKEFTEAVMKAKKYQAVIFDEAMRGLSSRQAMQEVTIMLVNLLAEIRQKNLFVFIVLPCFFELDRYPAIWRSRVLIHCYTGKGWERGYFSFYNVDKKKDLYMKGKKFMNYLVRPNFRGRFTHWYGIDEAEYRKKKLDSLGGSQKKEVPESVSFKKAKETLLNARAYMLKEGFNQKKISELWKSNHDYIRKIGRKDYIK